MLAKKENEPVGFFINKISYNSYTVVYSETQEPDAICKKTKTARYHMPLDSDVFKETLLGPHRKS
jgi:hypothetical protein